MTFKAFFWKSKCARIVKNNFGKKVVELDLLYQRKSNHKEKIKCDLHWHRIDRKNRNV